MHAHPHVHEHARRAGHEHARAHEHPHAEALGRTPLAAYGIGLVHGIGGSAGAGHPARRLDRGRRRGGARARPVRARHGRVDGAATLAFGHVLTRERVAVRLESAIPVLGVFGLLFGAWYALGSLEAVPYVF